MAKTDTPAKPNTIAEKKTRKVLTPAERIAKMEADLAEARKKEETKAAAKISAIDADITKLQDKIKELASKVDVLKLERQALLPSHNPEATATSEG